VIPKFIQRRRVVWHVGSGLA